MQVNLLFLINYLPQQAVKCLTLLLLLSVMGCANPTAPTGGPEDETPPSVVDDKSTPNFQTNFKPETIELTFDEWVKLQNANAQVLISPPFDGYEVRLKGKTVILDFGDKDTLRNNVTYVIQFGEAVKDLTEGNSAEDLRFVFSTGDEIDSLALSGQVVDAYTAEPIAKALILVYENLADSVFRTERPFYFGKTDEEGQFNISNMRAGNYKVCALMDSDGNYKFNQVNEQIAFLLEPLTLSEDTSYNLTLKLFQEQIPLKLMDTDSSASGLVKLTFNQPADQLLKAEGGIDFLQSFEKDTAFFWHQSPEPWTLYLSSDTLFYDTLKVPNSREGRKNVDLYSLPGQNLFPYPKRTFTLGISSPIVSLDTSKMQLLADTFPELLPFEWSIDSMEPRRIILERTFKESTPYELTAFPGAVTNIWNHSNTDTLVLKWNTADRKKFGNLHIEFTADDEEAIYFVKLLQKNKAPIVTYRLQGALSYEENIRGVSPGEYQLEIIRDDNANGKWDTGNYDALLQAEEIVIRPLENLRANWDLDVTVDLGAIFK